MHFSFIKLIFAKTAAGKLACLLCKRKFADGDKLRHHIKHSNLHKENLGNQEAAEKERLTSNKEKESEVYRDRAQERRIMYEPEMPGHTRENEMGISSSIASNTTMGPSLTQARIVQNADVVNPKDNLGDSNIGNKMLQKLGWKSGVSLGRKEADDAKIVDRVANDGVNDFLKKDWEKIESLAGGVKRGKERGLGHSAFLR